MNNMIKLLPLIWLLAASFSFADETIEGRYCYTYGDNESLVEARAITRTLAIRNALESYRVFVESTTTVKDFKLTNDLIQIITSSHLRDIKVIEYKEQGRKICIRIQATVSPQAIEKFIKDQVKERTEEIEEIGVDNNGYLKILEISTIKGYDEEEKSECSFIGATVKILQGAYWDVHSRRPPNVFFNICVDYYDARGKPYRSECKNLLRFDLEGQQIVPGMITHWSGPKICKGRGPTSYKVWLPKRSKGRLNRLR